tara:strand:+ start:1164 stop:1994 length:831 start_codon:yes stop_codon:yes gene_type:complete
MVGALSSELKLMSSQTKNLRASVDAGDLQFKLGIDKVTSNMRIEILNEDLQVIIGAKSTLPSEKVDKVDSDPGSMSQTTNDWVWDVGDDAKGKDGKTTYKTKLSEQTFEIGYGQSEYGDGLSIVPNCNTEGNECEYTISGASLQSTDIIYIAACQKDDRSTSDKKMTCSIQQLNAYGHVISPTDMTNQFKFSTYYPMGVVMPDAVGECAEMCVEGYGKMTEGFEENTFNNSPEVDNIYTAYQVIQTSNYCDLEEHITYSAQCPRPSGAGAVCDICD